MNLYEINLTKVYPGETEQEALRRFTDEVELNAVQESDFVVTIPKDDYTKLFRFARTLYEVNQCSEINVNELVTVYAKKLGYELSEDDLWHGILKWVERFADFADDDIEEWLN